jgi:hypothetical protein
MPSQIAISTFYSLSISKTFTHASNDNPFYCHCEERSDEAIYFCVFLKDEIATPSLAGGSQ